MGSQSTQAAADWVSQWFLAEAGRTGQEEISALAWEAKRWFGPAGAMGGVLQGWTERGGPPGRGKCSKCSHLGRSGQRKVKAWLGFWVMAKSCRN